MIFLLLPRIRGLNPSLLWLLLLHLYIHYRLMATGSLTTSGGYRGGGVGRGVLAFTVVRRVIGGGRLILHKHAAGPVSSYSYSYPHLFLHLPLPFLVTNLLLAHASSHSHSHSRSRSGGGGSGAGRDSRHVVRWQHLLGLGIEVGQRDVGEVVLWGVLQVAVLMHLLHRCFYLCIHPQCSSGGSIPTSNRRSSECSSSSDRLVEFNNIGSSTGSSLL
mmetsp:Transcript_26131/g.44055  ORF Transcript_26131/g.44055 Transcript_26131/m.44055 type:complete len:217 (-) Transcript_26131:244-894(-)